MKKRTAQSAGGRKKTTIRRKIMRMILSLVMGSLVILGVISCSLSYMSTIQTLEDSLTATASVAAGQVEYRLKSTLNVLDTLGCVQRLSDSSVTAEEKLAVLEQYRTFYGWNAAYVLLPDGTSLADPSNDFGDRAYFKSAMSGAVNVSDPTISKVTGKLVCLMAAPLWEGGIRDSKVVGVIMVSMDASVLSDLAAEINVSENGSAFILDSTGILIAHSNYDLVLAGTNFMEQAKEDSSLGELAALEEKMVAGETSFGSYTYEGQQKYLAFAPISGTTGWSIAVNAPQSDFMGSTYRSITIIIGILLLAMAISVVFSIRFAKSIGMPIQKCVDRIEKLAHGDLSSEVPVINTNDETKELAQSTELVVNCLKNVIGDIDYVVGEMSEGNFAVRTKAGDEAYVGDLQTILRSMVKLNSNLASTLTQINAASDQVASGAEQFASSAMGLSQGAIEQAASVEELAATIGEISVQGSETASRAKSAEKDVTQLGGNITQSSQQMEQLINAMKDINGASSEIRKIVKTIEDIAFQTNILALNAAVEAAHAGAAGMGFAVVAEEVRNLAAESAKAASNTTLLIERVLNAVEEGSHLVDETGVSLNKVVGQAEGVMSTIGEIMQATEQQAQAAEQVATGINQISNVVQSNSAAAEESAATSEELSAQAEILKNLVSIFKL